MFNKPARVLVPINKISQPQKYVNNYPPPHPFFFFLPLFLHFSKKIRKFRGFELPEPPLKYALVCYPLIKMVFSKY